MKARTVSAHLDGDLADRLQAVADQQDRSMSWLINAAVERYLGAFAESSQPFRDGAAKHYGEAAVKRGPVKSRAKPK
jgi:predicted transcriptional regulator